MRIFWNNLSKSQLLFILGLVCIINFATTVESAPVVVNTTSSAGFSMMNSRHIVRSSNGTLLIFYMYGTTGIYAKKSTDFGVTWTDFDGVSGNNGTQITNKDSTSGFCVWIDNYNNIFITYATYGSVYVKKLTYSGSSWTIGSEMTVEATNNTWAYPSIIKDDSNYVWIGYACGPAGKVRVKRTTDDANFGSVYDRTDDIVNTGLDGTSLVMWKGKPAIFSNSGSNNYIKWSYFDGSNWSSAVTAANSNTPPYDSYQNYSVTVTDDNYIHLVYKHSSWFSEPTYLMYKSCDATGTWSSPVTISTNVNNISTAITTDGQNLWYFWCEYISSNNYSIFYKKCINGIWDSSPTTFNSDALNQNKIRIPYKEVSSVIPIVWYEGTGPYNIKYDKIILPPKVNSLSPATASNLSSETITITGYGYYGGTTSNNVTQIRLDDPDNTVINSYSVTGDTSIINTIIPAQIKAGTYNVKITTTNGGENQTSSVKFIVTTDPPTVTNIFPSQVGNTGASSITVVGTKFYGGSTSSDIKSITLSPGGTNISFASATINDTSIANAIVPMGVSLGTYDVVVRTGGGSCTSAVKLVVVQGPTVTTINPQTVHNTNTATLSINGTGFSSSLSAVRLRGPSTVSLTGYSVVSDSVAINAVVPTQIKAGTYDVSVTTSNGTNDTSTNKFIVTADLPSVTVVTPNTGVNLNPTTISLTGTNFFGGTTSNDVQLIKLSNGTNLSGSFVVTDTTISGAVVPAGIAVGTYNVIVVTSAGESGVLVNNRFIVTGPPPTVTNVTPNTGENTGDIFVTITGTYFDANTGVNAVSKITLSGTKGNFSTTLYNYVDPDNLTNVGLPLLTQKIPAGTYDVQVTTSAGTNSTSAVKFIVTTGLPRVNSISPSSGSNLVNTTVNISGIGFFGGSNSNDVFSVKLNDVNNTPLDISNAVISDTLISNAVIPSGIKAGIYDIKVTTGGGTNATSGVKFIVVGPTPVVNDILPDEGINTEVATVTIKGTGFFGGWSGAVSPNGDVLSVRLDDMNETTVSGWVVTSDTLITGKIPSGILTGRYNIIVTTSAGSNTTSLKQFDVMIDKNISNTVSSSGIVIDIPANTMDKNTAILITDVSNEILVSNSFKIKYPNIKFLKGMEKIAKNVVTSNGAVISSGKLVTLTLNYNSLNINDPVVEKNFKILSLDSNNRWSIVESEQNVDFVQKNIKCEIFHFSIFGIGQFVSTASDLSNVVVYPNPVDFNNLSGGLIKFVNLTANPTLRIWTISGELVNTIVPDTPGNFGNDGRIEWDGKNKEGVNVNRGLYMYLITDEAGRRKAGKLVVK